LRREGNECRGRRVDGKVEAEQQTGVSEEGMYIDLERLVGMVVDGERGGRGVKEYLTGMGNGAAA
jgi:hypothetical protein